MFQPAGVRTLQLLRSLPARPHTTALEKADQDDCVIAEDVHRPPTAPATFGGPGAVDRMLELFEAHPLVVEDVESDEVEKQDTGSLLSEVGTVLHDLQSRWAEERESEIQRLWHQMEAEYELSLPRCDPGTPALGSLRARAGTGAAGFLSGTTRDRQEEGISTGDCGASPDEFSAEVEADVVTEAARRDLESAQELRRSVEARLASSSAEAVSETNVPAPDIGAEDDVARLTQLRQSVERLRARAEEFPALSRPLVGAEGSGSDTAEVPPMSTVATLGEMIELADPPFSALDDWIEDLRMFNSGVWKNHSTQPRAVASPQRNRNPNSLRQPASLRSPPASPSKKEMARVAEEKAMVWNSGQRNGLTPRLKAEQPSPCRTPKTTLQAARGGLLPRGPSSPSAHDQAHAQPISTVESQLDDILKDLDEIDRIHDDVCMLSHC
jgi:hypothetical protein